MAFMKSPSATTQKSRFLAKYFLKSGVMEANRLEPSSGPTSTSTRSFFFFTEIFLNGLFKLVHQHKCYFL